MNFDEMSDAEINMLVCMGKHDLENWGYFVTASGQQVFHMDSGTADERIIDVPDYCNSPDDAWPIILENDISIINGDYGGGNRGRWSAAVSKNIDGDCLCFGSDEIKNPLRAAMICYLKMKEAKS